MFALKIVFKEVGLSPYKQNFFMLWEINCNQFFIFHDLMFPTLQVYTRKFLKGRLKSKIVHFSIHFNANFIMQLNSITVLE